MDDFTQKTWPSDWIFVRNPDEKRYVRENGTLSVLAAGSKPDAKRFEGLACVRQPDMDFCMEADLCVDALACGVSAGLCVMVNHMMYMFWGVKRDEDGLELFLERRADDLDVITYTEKLDPQCTEDGWLRLTIRGTKECYAFGVTDGEGSVYGKCTASARFFANVFTGRGFTGTMTGLYAEAEGESEKMAVFRHFADHLVYQAHKGDQTVGRYPDGGNSFYIMNHPTIGQNNALHSYDKFIGTDNGVIIEEPDDIAAVLAKDNRISIRFAGTQLIIQGEASTIQLDIYSIAGLQQKHQAVNLDNGNATVSISDLPAGVYIAHVKGANGSENSCKFIIR